MLRHALTLAAVLAPAAAPALTIDFIAGTLQPPSASGETISSVDRPAVNNSGEVVYLTQGGGGFAVRSTVSGVIARQGDAVPGFAPDITFNRGLTVEVNNHGQVAMQAALQGNVTTADRLAIIGPNGVVARTGDAAPGGVLSNVGGVSLNDSDQTAFRGAVATNGVTFKATIHRDGDVLVETGAPPPGEGGAALLSIGGASPNNDGDIAYAGQTGISAGTRAIYTLDGAKVRVGDAIPQIVGATISAIPFSSDTHISLSNTGAISYLANLAGVDPAADAALFMDDVLIAREGDVVPGLSGRTIAQLSTRNAVSDTGAVAFQAEIAATGAIAAPLQSAIFARSSDGALNLVAREGDQLMRGDGRLGTVTNLIFLQHGFSDNGRYAAFEAQFASGSALYLADLAGQVSQVPLPASAWLLLSALALGAAMRPKRRSVAG